MNPDISVIIPTFNRAELLRRALASIVAQTQLPREIIVVDDGGADNTSDVVADCRNQLAARGTEVIYHRQANSGPAHARNTAMQMARGQLLAFLDSDDLWRPAFLQTMRQLLETYPAAALAFGGMDVIDLADKVWTHRPTGLPDQPRQGLLDKPFATIVAYMPMGTPCIMLRRSIAEEMKGFNVSYHLGEDWDLWYRISLRYDFAFTLDALTLCREHPSNMPKDNAAALADRVRLNLQYLPVAQGDALQALLGRHREDAVLYQEQLLREGLRDEQSLLDRAIAGGWKPKSLRFDMGHFMRRGPRWSGRLFAGVVRRIGHLKRSVPRSLTARTHGDGRCPGGIGNAESTAGSGTASL